MPQPVRVGAVKHKHKGGKHKRGTGSHDMGEVKLSALRQPKGISKYLTPRGEPDYQKPHVYDYDEYTGLWMFMPCMEMWYDSFEIQMAVAGLIFANFIVSAASSQLVADQSQGTVFVFKAFEYFFTYVFAAELVINMYAHGWTFWLGDQYGWNLFDFIVVSVSLLSLVAKNLPGISVLRLLRAFRVFRLFKRLKSLRQIIKALEASIPGVANAFAILLLVIGIYAILGVEFFRKSSPEYFSGFGKSMFSLFQVMTGESWAEMVARPIMDGMAPNCIIEYYAPMMEEKDSIRYPWETPGHYSTKTDVDDSHPDYMKHHAGMRPHYVGTFVCYVDDGVLLKNKGKSDVCNAAHEKRIRETCKGRMRLETTDNWQYDQEQNGDTGPPSWSSVSYIDGSKIYKNTSYINTMLPFKQVDDTIQPDKTAKDPNMDPDVGVKERFGYSGTSWKKSSLWLRPKDEAMLYSTKVHMEGLVQTGKKDANGEPVACDTSVYDGMCEPDGKLHWYTYEDYTRIYKRHSYCGRTASDSAGVHTFPKAGGPPAAAPSGETSGVPNRVTGYYPEVKAVTGECMATVTQIVGDRIEKVTRTYSPSKAIAAAANPDKTHGKITKADCKINRHNDGQLECPDATYQGETGWTDAHYPNTVGVTSMDATGYQHGQIPCPLYMQKDPAVVREARCFDYYLGMGNEECINNCLPQGLGSIYFVTFILFCGYMLVNVAISIVIEKMMDKEDDETPPERVYEIIKLPTPTEMVILLKSQAEKEHVLNRDDKQHPHYALPEMEIWIFEEGSAPDIKAFPPITIRSVDGDQVNANADRLEDPEVVEILKNRYGLTGAALDDAVKCTVTLQLASSLVGLEGNPAIQQDPKESADDALVNKLCNHKVLVENPPPTVDEMPLGSGNDVMAFKNQVRAKVDTLFIEVSFQLGKVLNQINALEYRVCALEDNPMEEKDLPDAVARIGLFASQDSPTNF